MTEIDTGKLRANLLAPGGLYTELAVVPSTGSTNADLRVAATEGAPDRTILIAEEQTAGVGRRARSWNSPKGAGIYLSVLLRPHEVPFSALGSLAMVAGLALMDLTNQLGVDAVLKWPNDVLAGPHRAKCAGILSEAVSSEEMAVVLGIGVNLRPQEERISPAPGGLAATSLAEEGASTVDPTEITELLLTALAAREQRWRSTGGDLARAGLLADYRAHCATIGQDVRVMLPDNGSFQGVVVDVDSTGQLLLTDDAGQSRTVFAGDIVHLRTQ